MNELLLITWVSASWKTTLQEELLRRWWSRPYNFTTREPRSDAELDEYVFLSKEQFLFKLKKWDFLEFTTYWWNFYWVSRALLWNKISIIVDPIWRGQIIEKVYREKLPYKIKTVFLEIDKKTQRERLNKRWDIEEEIKKRALDFNFFYPTPNCLILDWNLNTNELIEQLWI